MSEAPLRGLWVGSAPPAHRLFSWTICDPAGAAEALRTQPFALVAVQADWPAWAEFADSVAVVLLRANVALDDAATFERAMNALRAGAQDVLATGQASTVEGALRLCAAAERHRQRLATRQAFATDVHTGLPHEGQLLEHMSHLTALREREPAPMALLALRIEGFATTSARLGADAAGALRRKVAVRLRAGVRSSDVVASLGSDSFAVLLSSIEAPADAARVAAKLQAALAQPFKLGVEDVALATALGIAASPADGTLPAQLLRRAVGLAASATAVGRSGFANRAESGGAPGAANDD